MAHERKRAGRGNEVIYGSNGAPVYRLLSQTRIVDFEGRSVAWIDEEGNIYDYHGVHRGWYEGGAWVGHDGGIVGFGDRVDGPCPALPPREEALPRARRPVREPRRPSVYFPPPRPPRRAAWARRPLGSPVHLNTSY